MNPRNAHLLVAEDNSSMRNTICFFLRSLGFTRIDEAEDGLHALELFRCSRYDLVITDWQMPRATGIELLQAIRAGSERAGTPVLVLTGYITRARVMEALREGANGFIGKPFLEQVLAEHVLHLVGAAPSVTLAAAHLGQ